MYAFHFNWKGVMAVSFSIFQLVNLNIYETFERLCFNESKGKKGIQCINYCQSKIVEMCQMLIFFLLKWIYGFFAESDLPSGSC